MRREKSIYEKPRVSSSLVQHFFGEKKIKQQLYSTYIVGLLVPILALGLFLVINTFTLLKNYHVDLASADNLRVKALFYELSAGICDASSVLYEDEDLSRILSSSYDSSEKFESDVVKYIDLYYGSNKSEMMSVFIYTDNPKIPEYKIFRKADEAVKESEFYTKAMETSELLWLITEREDNNGNNLNELSLVRRLNSDEPYNSVLVLSVNANYLRTRVETGEFLTGVFLEDGETVYLTRTDGTYPECLPIDFNNPHYFFAGDCEINDSKAITRISTQSLFGSDSPLYISTTDVEAYGSIRKIIFSCLILIIAAIFIPGIFIFFYTHYIAERIEMLRNEMHKASQGDYNVVSDFRGNDELSDAFRDLQHMVEKIIEQDAEVYTSELGKKDLENKQREMEFKMLASQINPHFLYNTLESIRMKAFTVGDKEVAEAIKLLGKSLRYVLDNTGTALTSVQSELDHVENYIRIQKMRFGDKFGYEIERDPNLRLDEIKILPLILQPLVENSILHGLEEKEEGGIIKVSVRGTDKEVQISVEDNGCGMSQEETRKLRNSVENRNPEIKSSIGLYNINQRLILSYGKKAGLQIMSEEGKGTIISFTFPIDKK